MGEEQKQAEIVIAFRVKGYPGCGKPAEGACGSGNCPDCYARVVAGHLAGRGFEVLETVCQVKPPEIAASPAQETPAKTDEEKAAAAEAAKRAVLAAEQSAGSPPAPEPPAHRTAESLQQPTSPTQG